MSSSMSTRISNLVHSLHRQSASNKSCSALGCLVRLALPKGTLLFVAANILGSTVHAMSIANPVSVFSTYPSESLSALCQAQTEQGNCVEDIIKPVVFVDAIRSTNVFTTLTPFSEGSDYEVLVANLGMTSNEANSQFVEFTLQWRGIEIDNATFASNDKSLSHGNTAEVLVAQWLEHVKQQRIFSSSYLYEALEASNYESSLTVPENIGEFTRLDTQLYSDPFNGAITRYTHPAYEDALVDVTVYPIFGTLDTADSELLNGQLNEDLERASSVAKAQELTLSLSSPASPYMVSPAIQGWRLGLKAESTTTPTIYASTYVFRQEDKIVKVATTFPTDFSDPLVNELITHVQVPKESMLMKNIRAMLSEQVQ